MGGVSETQRAFWAAEWAKRMEVIEAENAAREPVLCECLSGLPVTTIQGCEQCASEAEERYIARLLGMTIVNGRLVDLYEGERDDPNYDYAGN